MRGLPATGPINAVREDIQRRGLLFAGSETGVSVSFDDGENWQSLRQNMPATSVRDLVIKDQDLVVGTHGRGFWILDDITPLRQVTPDVLKAPAFLFRPGVAWRFRDNKNTDTPWPPDEPTAPNPPDGAIISYVIGAGTKGPVTLDIIESATNETIRRYSSDDPAEPPVAAPNHPDYWIRPAARLATTPGLHRFVWDLRYAPPPVDRVSYPIAATYRNTPRAPRGAFVLPGTYQVRLTVGDRVLRQAVVVRMDPRVRTSTADLTLQLKLSKAVDGAIRRLAAARADVNTRAASATGDAAAPLQAALRTLQDAFAPLQGLFESLQEADLRPTPAVEAAVTAVLQRVDAALAEYKDLGGRF